MKRHSCLTSTSLGLLLLLVGLLACAAPSWGQSLNECGGYYVAYFNGVRTTFFNAVVGAKRLRELVAEDSTFTRCRPTGCVTEPVINGVFYNPSGGYLTDLKELFQQRASEINRSGELERRLEYFWEVIAGGGRHLSFTDRLATAVIQYLAVVNQIKQIGIANVTASLTRILGDSDTQGVLAAHREQLDEQAAQGRKMLLVAHSQGNLFVNEAHDYIEQEVGVASVEVVHIAPATRDLRGPHVLASIDVVISGLRTTQGPEGIPLVTHHIPFDLIRDPLGHGLLETYLDPGRATIRHAIELHMRAALKKLETPEDFPPPPTDLRLYEAGDTHHGLHWEPPLYEMEPLECDMPGYLVYRDDHENPRFSPGDYNYFHDTKPPDPEACYEVTARLRTLEESEPSDPICPVHVHLHISAYTCMVAITPETTDPERARPYTTVTLKGTATGPVGAILTPLHQEYVGSSHYDTSTSCPGWQRRTQNTKEYSDAAEAWIAYRRIYCVRGPEDNIETTFSHTGKSAGYSYNIHDPIHSPDNNVINLYLAANGYMPAQGIPEYDFPSVNINVHKIGAATCKRLLSSFAIYPDTATLTVEGN